MRAPVVSGLLILGWLCSQLEFEYNPPYIVVTLPHCSMAPGWPRDSCSKPNSRTALSRRIRDRQVQSSPWGSRCQRPSPIGCHDGMMQRLGMDGLMDAGHATKAKRQVRKRVGIADCVFTAEIRSRGCACKCESCLLR